MRLLPSLCLLTALSFGATAWAADAADEHKPVNTVCPISGKKIDPSIPPVEAKTADGKTIWIGVCSEGSATKIKKDPAKYVKAAMDDKTIAQEAAAGK